MFGGSVRCAGPGPVDGGTVALTRAACWPLAPAYWEVRCQPPQRWQILSKAYTCICGPFGADEREEIDVWWERAVRRPRACGRRHRRPDGSGVLAVGLSLLGSEMSTSTEVANTFKSIHLHLRSD